ncbi:MAG: hypothetical protein HYX32_07125 [Actinobacteria bacterium]|nr:hypothetical protein [Actinomycetota bacterium]
MTAGPSVDRVTAFRAPLYVRGFFVLLGVAASIGFVAKFLAAGEPVFLVFVPLCVPVVLEGVRGRLVVDLDSGTITSQRAFRSSRCAITDVVSMWIPAWGPVGLVLKPGVSGASPVRPGQIITALYTDKSSAGRMYALAALLNVPLESGWQGISWSPDPGPDHPPGGGLDHGNS